MRQILSLVLTMLLAAPVSAAELKLPYFYAFMMMSGCMQPILECDYTSKTCLRDSESAAAVSLATLSMEKIAPRCSAYAMHFWQLLHQSRYRRSDDKVAWAGWQKVQRRGF